MRNSKVTKMVQMAILIAIIALMAFTPIGFIKTAGLEIQLIMIPVVIGAMLFGPLAGAVCGGAFGILSFIQCFGMSHVIKYQPFPDIHGMYSYQNFSRIPHRTSVPVV